MILIDLMLSLVCMLVSAGGFAEGGSTGRFVGVVFGYLSIALLAMAFCGRIMEIAQ
jgi:hypothetical protein